jgi:general secretion pathway protein K
MIFNLPSRPMQRRAPPSPARAQGFALVATLFAVALIALGAAYFAQRVETLRENAFQTQRWAEAERDAFSIRETLQFAAATHVRDIGGLMHSEAAFPLDGRPYNLGADLTLRVQDERGLIGLNSMDDALLTRLFSDLGIPADQHQRMIDSLKDYMDVDDFKMLNGAERRDYEAAGRVPPPNDFIRAREELADILGWEGVFEALDRADLEKPGIRERFLARFSVARHIGININSAPADVLRLVPGINPLRVAALVDQRQAKPFANIAELAPYRLVGGAPLDEEIAGLVGADTWRVTIGKRDLPFLLECQLEVTPGDWERPTKIKQCRRRTPDIMAEGEPNEFQLALQASPRFARGGAAKPAQPNIGTSLRVSNEITLATTINRDRHRRNQQSAPRWLAESIANPDHVAR